jgi:YjbE family integral membrane protein
MLGIDASSLAAFFNVIMIDLVLAGDNAVVIGLAAAGLAPDLRRRAILIGIGAATVLRICFALITTHLLALGGGLLIAGGLLLLWVCWKMYRELTVTAVAAPAFAGLAPHGGAEAAQTMTFGAALVQIVVADVSMSLDNVLAVAGAAKGQIWVLVVGLTVAVAFMALLSAYIAKLLARYHWITWIGLAIVFYVAAEMIWTGSHQVGCQFVSKTVCDSGALTTLSTLLS